MSNKRITYKLTITWNDWREDDDEDFFEFFKGKIDKLVEDNDGEIDDYTIIEH